MTYSPDRSPWSPWAWLSVICVTIVVASALLLSTARSNERRQALLDGRCPTCLCDVPGHPPLRLR